MVARLVIMQFNTQLLKETSNLKQSKQRLIAACNEQKGERVTSFESIYQSKNVFVIADMKVERPVCA